MLIDTEFLYADRLSRARATFSGPACEGPPMDPERIEQTFGYEVVSTGVTLSPGNGGLALKRAIDLPRQRSKAFRSDDRLWGVADSAEQVLAHLDAGRIGFPCNVVLAPVPRNPGGTGGWRWSHNGRYIGTMTPTCEYLDDEPEIDRVIVFSLVPLDVGKVEALRLELAPAIAA
jgi:hypothetical protein